jgi:signal transduction histidine kinase
MDAEPDIPWARFAAFVRQQTHDVRNGLNSLDLEAALLQELVVESEGRASVERVRGQVRALGGQMRSLSALVQDMQPAVAPLAARELFLIWEEQQAALPQPPEVRWVDELGSEQVAVDADMMAAVFRELLANAAAFSEGGTVTASARREADEVVFELREPKIAALDTSAWGEPLVTTRRGGYGLGLWSVHRRLAANHARITQRHVPEEGGLVTRILIPICK